MMSVPSFVGQVVVAAAILVGAVWAPGRLLTRALRLSLEPVETMACALGCGMSLLALVYWLLNLVHGPFLILGYATACSIIELWQVGRTTLGWKRSPLSLIRPTMDRLRRNWPIAVILVLSVGSQVRFLFGGGWFGADGLLFPWCHVHDSPDHIFLIHQQC